MKRGSKDTYNGATEAEYKGMRGLAAAIIRQAFEDAGSKYAPLIEVYKYSVRPELGTSFKFGSLEGNKLYTVKTEELEEIENGKVKKVKKSYRVQIGSKSDRFIYRKDNGERLSIQDIPNGNQKLLYKGKTPVGYIDKSKCFYCKFNFNENGEMVYNVEKKIKKKNSASQMLSKAEVYEARNFILAETRYWKTSLEFWCDVADLDWSYIVRLAKKQDWYPEYSKGIN